MDPIQFPRTPYNVTYYKDGKKVTMRRVPPPKIHEALPEDIVKLTSHRSEDFPAHETYKVKHISSRQPNVLQLENSDGQTTFVPYYEMELKEKIAPRPGEDRRDNPRANRYLQWP